MPRETSWNKRPDWAKIERQYRAGLLSVLEIAAEHRIPESNIRYHARTKGWKRDLSDEVRQTTRVKLVENLANVFNSDEVIDKLKEASDESIIEEASRTQVHVVREHQRTLGSGHSLTMRMLNELDASTAYKGELQELISSTVAPKRQEALRRAVSLGSRATIMRDLATAARLWVTLERQAFGIADDRDKPADDRKKLDEMSSEDLRREIKEDAKKLGLDLQEAGMEEDKLEGIAGKVH